MRATNAANWIDGLTDTDALIIVDVQRDFLPGGALEVPDGDAVIEPLNHYAAQFARRGSLIVATRDWHPANHHSFKHHGGRWPKHCVAGTHGAEYSPELVLPHDTKIVSKGERPGTDGYSAFEGTELTTLLCASGVRRVFIGGLATDYCVRATALDALRNGFDVTLLADAMRAVDLAPGDGARAIRELVSQGAHVARTPDAVAA